MWYVCIIIIIYIIIIYIHINFIYCYINLQLLYDFIAQSIYLAIKTIVYQYSNERMLKLLRRRKK